MTVTTEIGGVPAEVPGVADEEFRAMACGDVAAFLSLLSPDVVFFPPNEAPRSGSAVAPWIGQFLSGYTVEFLSYRHDECFLAEGRALLRTSFKWRVTPRAGGEDFVRQGNSMRVFRQDETGAWLLTREIWTTYPAT
jgi:ketosteroid isomerase-like protein